MKRRFKRIFFGAILLVGLILIGVSGYNILSQQMDYNKSNELYSQLELDNVVKYVPGDNWYKLAKVDLDSVKKINSDVIGWIFFENEDISYPILYSGDDSTYLRKTLEGGSATAGSIFLEGKNNPDLEDSYSIIYGHNMKNMSMFGKLKLYNRDDKYYDEHQFFQIFVDGAVHRYQIFSYETVGDDSFLYKIGYEPGEDFLKFINQIRGLSMRTTDIEVKEDDKVISLSTCSTSGDEYRFVVNAVRVDSHFYEGEE